MSWLTRYAAAIFHLGLRQAGLNLVHRALRYSRRFGRYAHTPGELTWIGRPTTPFLRHGGGAHLDGRRFTAIGRSFEVGDPPDWERDAPLLWLFNLHYFAFLHLLPPPEQARLVLDWIDRNPPGARRPGWQPYPLSMRLRHWVQWLFEARELRPSDHARILASIEGQGDCLADTLEHHLRGNHLLESGLSLCFLAACFAGPRVERWRRLGRGVLERELPEQFLPDGGHFERSPMYHALLTRGLLDLVNVLPEPDPLRSVVLERLPALLRFLAAMRHPDGEIALLNDAAFGIAPPPADLLEYAARLGQGTTGFAAGSFAAAGYHVWRQGRDALFVDAGPIGPDYLSTHGHGDMFSYEFSLDGRRVVVDGGTSTYEAGAERDWVRSTRAHNTVELDGKDQCEFFAAFRVGRRGRPRDVTAEVFAEELQLAGWHDGYRRLRGRPVHHREVELKTPRTLLVWDTIESGAALPAVSRVRFAPGARVRLESPQLASIEIDGLELALHAFGGELTLESDWYAPAFGERLPCPVLALRKGATPEFGYALAPRGLAVSIDAAGADVTGRRHARRARRAGSGR